MPVDMFGNSSGVMAAGLLDGEFSEDEKRHVLR
jgi:hypothetical protein